LIEMRALIAPPCIACNAINARVGGAVTWQKRTGRDLVDLVDVVGL